MVTAEYTQMGKGFCLVVCGHAGTAPEGEDLVCCAASTLVYTAAQCAFDFYGEGVLQQFPEIITKSGNAQVAVVATEEGKERVEQMYRTVATGLELLARQYPKHVGYIERHGGSDAEEIGD